MIDFGPVVRWKEGDILIAENDFISGAYVVTNDAEKVGTLDLYGPQQICVEYINAETGKLWETH